MFISVATCAVEAGVSPVWRVQRHTHHLSPWLSARQQGRRVAVAHRRQRGGHALPHAVHAIHGHLQVGREARQPPGPKGVLHEARPAQSVAVNTWLFYAILFYFLSNHATVVSRLFHSDIIIMQKYNLKWNFSKSI